MGRKRTKGAAEQRRVHDARSETVTPKRPSVNGDSETPAEAKRHTEKGKRVGDAWRTENVEARWEHRNENNARVSNRAKRACKCGLFEHIAV